MDCCIDIVMSQWQIQIMIPDFPDARLGEQLPGTVLQEIGSQRQVRREIYRYLNRAHQGFFVSSEAAELVSGVATALLSTLRVLEGVGLAMPPELSVVLSQRTTGEEANTGVRHRPASG